MIYIFNSDIPVVSANEDMLGRSKFAQNVANAISSYNNSECLTIGIYGGWGEGKTSLANMIVESLPSEKFAEVYFNPWLYSNKENLISQLFQTISRRFKMPDINDAINKTSSTLEKISKVAKVVKYTPIPLVKEISESVSDLMSDYAEAIKYSGEKSVDEQKEIISKALEDNNIRLLILIDDFDRLTKEEIRLLFQVVKALGDFKNTTYLLLMDYNVVINSLGDIQGGKGEDYLKKIVQVPITLPPIDNYHLKQILHSEFKRIVGDKYDENKDLFEEIIVNSCLPFINNIRDIKRIVNLFEFKRGFLNNDVNQCDLFGLCALELNNNPIFEYIQNHFDIITKYDYMAFLSKCDKENNILQPLLVDQQTVDAIGVFFNNDNRNDKSEIRFYRRLSDPQYFNSYFSLILPNDNVPSVVIEKILNEHSVTQIQEEIKSGRYNIQNLLYEIKSKISKCDLTRLEILMKALIDDYSSLTEKYNISYNELDDIVLSILSKMPLASVKNYFNNHSDRGHFKIFLYFLFAQETRLQLWKKGIEYSKYSSLDDGLHEIEELFKKSISLVSVFDYEYKDFEYIIYACKKLECFDTCRAYFEKYFNQKDNALKLICANVENENSSDEDFNLNYSVKIEDIDKCIDHKELYKHIINHSSNINGLEKPLMAKICAFILCCEENVSNNHIVSYNDIKEKMKEYP